MVSYVFVGYDDYSVLQLCVDGTGEAGLVQMAESFNAGIAFPLVAGVLYFTHNIIWFMCFLSGEPFMDAELFRY